ncbi:MAG: helix-turn-helix domain-containing protein, partial [Ruthenibacterium sp.]
QCCNRMHAGLFLLTSDEVIVGLTRFPEDETLGIAPILQSIQTLQAAVRTQLHATVSAGVSELCTELAMLPQAYEQAKCCAKQSLFYGNESVFQFHQLEAERPSNIAYFDTDCIQKSLLSGNHEATFAEIERVFLTFEGGPVREYQFVDQMCLSLLFHVSLWGLQYNVQMEDVFHSMGTTYTDIYRCDTLLKKQEFLKALLFAVQMELEQRRNTTRGSSVAHQMCACVDKEFCSNAMSLEYVAERVHKNAAYVSKVFKNEIGCNFSDYLTQKRMEKALLLLAQPACKIYQIAQECGYADVSNFIKVFKKNRGISPNEYRTVLGAQHEKA